MSSFHENISNALSDPLIFSQDESDESSDSDSEDSEEEEEEPIRAPTSSSIPPQSLDRSKGFTSSSAASLSRSIGTGRSIDQDTLFGVKPPSSAASNPPASSISGNQIASTQQGQRNGNGKDVRMLGGKIDETVFGRKFDQEKDYSYSASSPTPYREKERKGER